MPHILGGSILVQIKRRHELSSSKIKDLINNLKERYGSKILDLFEQATKIEIIETPRETVYAIDGRILFIEKNNLIFPTIKMVQKERERIELPEVVVDMGAVPYVCRGANIMRPGIVAFSNPETKKGQIVQILDEKNRVIIAIGRLQMNGADIQQKQKGPIIENLTWVGDVYWQLSL